MIAFNEIENHKNGCLFRLITCPSNKDKCGLNIPFNSLEHHLLKECTFSFNNSVLAGEMTFYDVNSFTYTDSSNEIFEEGNPFKSRIWKSKSETFIYRNEIQGIEVGFAIVNISSKRKFNVKFQCNKPSGQDGKIELIVPVLHYEDHEKTSIKINKDLLKLFTEYNEAEKNWKIDIRMEILKVDGGNN